MTGNPRFDQMIAKMQAIHKKKSHDYASTANPYQNFEDAADIVGCSVDVVFRVMIAIKMARLKELLGTGKEAKNESVEDTQLDLATYSALYASYREKVDTPPPYKVEFTLTGFEKYEKGRSDAPECSPPPTLRPCDCDMFGSNISCACPL